MFSQYDSEFLQLNLPFKIDIKNRQIVSLECKLDSHLRRIEAGKKTRVLDICDEECDHSVVILPFFLLEGWFRLDFHYNGTKDAYLFRKIARYS